LWLSASSGSATGEARTSSAPCTVYRIWVSTPEFYKKATTNNII
jgi:hypothetical protein